MTKSTRPQRERTVLSEARRLVVEDIERIAASAEPNAVADPTFLLLESGDKIELE